MNTQSLALDVSKRPQTMPVVHVRSGDANGTLIAVAVKDNGTDADLTGLDAVLRAKLSDGTLYAVDGSVSGSVATFQIDESELPAGAAETAYVELAGEDSTYSTQGFALIVEEGIQE